MWKANISLLIAEGLWCHGADVVAHYKTEILLQSTYYILGIRHAALSGLSEWRRACHFTTTFFDIVILYLVHDLYQALGTLEGL